MTESQPAPSALSGRTAWARSLETPLRQFLRTETGSAAILLAATLTALAWANLAPGTYQGWWHTQLSVHVGGRGLDLTLREWVNSGLMTFFFLVAGLEARREFDLGELRERRRLALPLAAGLGGLLVPVSIFLAINAGHGTARGWGAAMSTDTAFALGMLALVGPRLPDRARTYLLTFAIVDDLVALTIIAFVYSGPLSWPPLLAGLLILVAAGAGRRFDLSSGPAYALAGAAAWVAFWESGVDPIVVGLLMGLMTAAYTAARPDLERASRATACGRPSPPTPGCSGSTTPGRATSSCRCSPWPTRESASAPAPWAPPSARRSPSASWSATWPASRPAPSAPPGCCSGSAGGGCGRRSAGPP
jgi:Na+/H+ antiporter NhaA